MDDLGVLDTHLALSRANRDIVGDKKGCGAEDFGVGDSANFLEKGIQSLGNFGFQGSQSLRS